MPDILSSAKSIALRSHRRRAGQRLGSASVGYPFAETGRCQTKIAAASAPVIRRGSVTRCVPTSSFAHVRKVPDPDIRQLPLPGLCRCCGAGLVKKTCTIRR
jgi:hypothetical protein